MTVAFVTLQFSCTARPRWLTARSTYRMMPSSSRILGQQPRLGFFRATNQEVLCLATGHAAGDRGGNAVRRMAEADVCVSFRPLGWVVAALRVCFRIAVLSTIAR